MNSESAGAPDCAKCGVALRTAALFCARCGTRVSAVELESQAVIEPAGPSMDRRQELRVVGWFYGLLLATSFLFGIAYRIEPTGDFGAWDSLVFAIVISAFAIHYRTEVLALLRPAFDGNALRALA